MNLDGSIGQGRAQAFQKDAARDVGLPLDLPDAAAMYGVLHHLQVCPHVRHPARVQGLRHQGHRGEPVEQLRALQVHDDRAGVPARAAEHTDHLLLPDSVRVPVPDSAGDHDRDLYHVWLYAGYILFTTTYIYYVYVRLFYVLGIVFWYVVSNEQRFFKSCKSIYYGDLLGFRNHV